MFAQWFFEKGKFICPEREKESEREKSQVFISFQIYKNFYLNGHDDTMIALL